MIVYYLGRKYVRSDLPMAVSNARHNRQRHMDDDTLVRYAEQALKRPPDFGYYGNYPLFWSWGMTPVAQNRDSGPLERSNYEGWTMTPHQAMRIIERALSGDTAELKAAQINEAINRLWELVLKGT